MRAAAISRFVLDASVAVAWCFQDEATAYTESVLDRLASDVEAVVPAIWPFEVANALLVAERRKRLKLAQTAAFLRLLAGFRITVEPTSSLGLHQRVLPVARERNLAVYDAAYLELAIREGLSLATTDTRLRRAAQAAGVEITQ